MSTSLGRIEMAVYFITGTLGCGKTLCTVGKIRDYLAQGRRVATNLDINLESMCKTDSMASITRVPDKPNLFDLESIGLGCEESNEDKYGLLVLDELGTWFNSRNWRDNGRLDVINWFLHARKKHWDIYFIVQSIESLDGQLVNSLCEHLVICKRTDRLTLPVVGPLLKTLGVQKVLPKIHIAKVYYGQTTSSMAVDRWWYRGKDLYSTYNTDQIFEDTEFYDTVKGETEVRKSNSVFSVLPAYYRNHVALIKHHHSKIEMLTKDSKQQAPTERPVLKLAASILFTVFIGLLGTRTYAKMQDYRKPVIEIPVQVMTKKDSKVEVSVSTILMQKQVINIDHIQSITQGREVHASSIYQAEGRINAVLHTLKDDDHIAATFTLDDTRALGYIVVLHGRIIEVQKQGYYFTFVSPIDLSKS